MTTGSDWLDTARRVVDTFLTPPAAATAPPSTPPTASPPTASPSTASAAGERPAQGPAHADTCRWCPVCQAMAVARGERPEVTAALADLLTTTAEALRTFAESAPMPRHEPAPDGGTAAPGDPEPDVPPAPTVQRIDIG